MRAHVRIGGHIALPPAGELAEAALDPVAQQQEVKRRTELGVLHGALGVAALTAGQSLLQRPDVAHVRGETTGHGDDPHLGVQHLVDRQHEGVIPGQAALVLQHPTTGLDTAPQQGGIQEGGCNPLLFTHPGIGIDQRLLDKLLVRGVAVRGKERGHLREQLLEQAVLAQQLVGRQRIAGQEQLEGLLEQTRGRNILQQRRQLLDGGSGARADGHVQLGGKAHGAQHPHRVFAVAGLGIANKLQLALRQIFQPALEIVQGEILDAVVEGVDGEVAALGILFDGAVDVVTQQHAFIRLGRHMFAGIDLMVVTPEGGHFDHVTTKDDVGQAEATANQAAVAEQCLDLLRRRIGGDVEILWRLPEQQIPDAAADQVGVIASLVQAIEHLECIFADLFARNRVLITAQGTTLTGDTGRNGGLHRLLAVFLAEHLAAKVCDLGKNGTPLHDFKLTGGQKNSGLS